MTASKRPRADVSLEEMLQRFKPRAEALLARFHVPPADGEDLLQQTILAYLYKQNEVRNVQAWLVGTLRNRCLMYWRARRRSPYVSVDSTVLESIAEPGPPAQEQSELSHDIEQVVGALSERYQAMLKLRYELGCKPPETARRLGYKPSGAYKLMERCLDAVAKQMMAVGMEDDPRNR